MVSWSSWFAWRQYNWAGYDFKEEEETEEEESGLLAQYLDRPELVKQVLGLVSLTRTSSLAPLIYGGLRRVALHAVAFTPRATRRSRTGRREPSRPPPWSSSRGRRGSRGGVVVRMSRRTLPHPQ